MGTNWIIIGAVVVLAIVLILYLIRQNQKDEKDVEERFTHHFKSDDEDSELNDER